MCETLGVTTSGFYAWQTRGPSTRQRADLLLGDRIEAIFKGARSTYCRPRIPAGLRDAGIAISKRSAAASMRERNIYGALRPKWTTTTVRNQNAGPTPDFVHRKFIAEHPDQLWVADMTYIPTWFGFLYLALVLDVCSRLVVGWAMANHL
jgi:putative transposase